MLAVSDMESRYRVWETDRGSWKWEVQVRPVGGDESQWWTKWRCPSVVFGREKAEREAREAAGRDRASEGQKRAALAYAGNREDAPWVYP